MQMGTIPQTALNLGWVLGKRHLKDSGRENILKCQSALKWISGTLRWVMIRQRVYI